MNSALREISLLGYAETLVLSYLLFSKNLAILNVFLHAQLVMASKTSFNNIPSFSYSGKRGRLVQF